MSTGNEPEDDVVTAVLAGGPMRLGLTERLALDRMRRDVFGRSPGPVQLSRYVLLRRLAAGASGVVFVAYDPELDRKVAVKVVQWPGHRPVEHDTRGRALREARVLARLSHPNVVPIFDVGTYGGPPPGDPAREPSARPGEDETRGMFIVMELVEGSTLHAWLQTARTHREILGAFVEAGRGLAAAHSQGVVHRDFKPGNVIIGTDGRTRVLDFGIARSAARPEDEQDPGGIPGDLSSAHEPDRITHAGTVLGTPAYMSPEQHAGASADARSDQFAFCVALFEALFETRPFEGDMDGLAEAKRAGRIHSEALSPSVPAHVTSAIVRGLSPDPQDRYPSMMALLADLERDPTRLRRRALAAGGLVAIAAVAGVFVHRYADRGACQKEARWLAGVWDEPTREAIQRSFLRTELPYAQTTWETVDGALQRYAGAWVEQRTVACEQSLDPGQAAAARAATWCLDRQLQHLRALTTAFREADPDVLQGAVAAVSQLPSLGFCVSDSERQGVTDDREERLRLERLLARARSARLTAKLDRARADAREAQDIAEVLGDETGVARALLQRGEIELMAQQADLASDLLFDALERAERLGNDRLAGTALIRLATVQVAFDGDDEGAERSLRLAAIKLEEGTPTTWEQAELELAWARLSGYRGAYRDAVHRLERARDLYGEAHPSGPSSSYNVLELAKIENVLGINRRHAGDRPGARQALDHALDLYRTNLGEEHPLTAMAYGNLATVEDDPVRALDLKRKWLRLARATLPPDHPDIATAANNLGVSLVDGGQLDEALARYREALAVYAARASDSHLPAARTHGNISEVLRLQGRLDAAVLEAEQARAMTISELGPDHPRLEESLTMLGRALVARGDPDDAQIHLAEAIRVREAAQGKQDSRLGEPLLGLAAVLVARGQRDEAEDALRRAIRLLEADEREPIVLAEARFALATLLPEREAEVRSLVAQANRVLGARPGLEARLDQWLAGHASPTRRPGLEASRRRGPREP